MSFHRAFNGIFAKVGRLASEDVVMQLLKHKRLPILLYALEVCNLDRRTVQSLYFTLNRFLVKLFKTSNLEIVRHCQTVISCELPSVLLSKRYANFIESLPTNNCYSGGFLSIVFSTLFRLYRLL